MPGIFQGIEREFSFEVEGIPFSGNYPLPSDERNIALQVSARLSQFKIDTIPEDIYILERIFVTLNYVLDAIPEELGIEDFSNYPDIEFTVKVFDEYEKGRKELNEKLKKNNYGRRNKTGIKEPGNGGQPVFNEELPNTPKGKKVFKP